MILKKISILLLLFTSLISNEISLDINKEDNDLSGIRLETIINNALIKNHSLEAIEEKLKANKNNVKTSNQFSNPEFSLTTNTIDSSEPMSQTVFSLKQKIEFYSKRDKREDISLAEEEVTEFKLKLAKIKLVEQIKISVYKIWKYEEDKKIIEDYIEITKRNIKIYESYSSIGYKEHSGIMKTKLMLFDLMTERERIKSRIYESYSNLSYLASFEISKVNIKLDIYKKPNLEKLKSIIHHNPEISLKNKEIKQQTSKVSLSDTNQYPDINLLAGYAYRKNFDDYFNFGVSLSLPIYGTESTKKEVEMSKLLSKKSEMNDVETKILSQIKIYYSKMLSSYNIYHILKDEALPELNHMFDISINSISAGGDLFKYTDIVYRKLELDKKVINSILNYNMSKAKIEAIQGERI